MLKQNAIVDWKTEKLKGLNLLQWDPTKLKVSSLEPLSPSPVRTNWTLPISFPGFHLHLKNVKYQDTSCKIIWNEISESE